MTDIIETSPQAEEELRTKPQASLIPDDDPISELLEDIRLEHSSYELIEDVRTLAFPQRCLDDLVGLFILDGAVEISAADGQSEFLQRADFILMTPGERYSVRPTASGPCSIGRVTYAFDAGRARLLLKLLPPAFVVRQLSNAEIEWQLTLARLISDRSEAGGIANAAINRRLVEAALIGVIQQYLQRNPQLRRNSAGPSLAEIAPSIQAIHHNPDHPWTIAGLARVSGMSRTLFAAKFLESTGETPGRYLTILRMERARDLLCRSSLSLATIAHRAGYGTDVAFARAFKRQFGVSPGRFRADRH